MSSLEKCLFWSSAHFFFKFIFNWRIITLQYCVGFWDTSTWVSHRYTYVLSLLNLPPSPPHPSRFLQSPSVSSLNHTANFHWLSCYAKWSNSEREKQISCINEYMWTLERWYWWTCLQSNSEDAEAENRLVETGCFKGRMREWAGPGGLSRVREGNIPKSWSMSLPSGSVSASWRRESEEFILPHRLGDWGPSLPDFFQRMAFRSLRKALLSCRRWIRVSKGQRKDSQL